MNNILVILGPTASGKSDLAVTLAKRINGEIISADSRQVYKGLDIGTGKITKKEMKGIPHHLLDVADPTERFTVQDFQDLAYPIIDDVLKRGKLPIICGGTGFYIQAIVDGIVLPDVQLDKALRTKLAKLDTVELFKMLKKLDPKRAKDIDQQNRVRIIRAIEIAEEMGKVPKLKAKPRYKAEQFGIYYSDELLKGRIRTRLEKRMKDGMIEEVEKLHKKGLSWKRMEELGLEYRYLALYLQKKISKEQMISELETKIWQYAKKQMTWFKRDGRIQWVHVTGNAQSRDDKS